MRHQSRSSPTNIWTLAMRTQLVTGELTCSRDGQMAAHHDLDAGGPNGLVARGRERIKMRFCLSVRVGKLLGCVEEPIAVLGEAAVVRG